MKRPTETARRRGSALLVVLIAAFGVSALLITVSRAASQRSFTAQRMARRVRAQSIAEAGVSRGYQLLAGDFRLRTNAVLIAETAYGGGTYEVSSQPVGDAEAVLTGRAVYRNVEQTVVLDLHRREIGVPDSGEEAYTFAILADGEISWTGCGVFQGHSTVHANDAFKQAGCGELNADISSSVSIVLKGNSGEIDGDATAPSVSGKTGKITGTLTEQAVPNIPLPEIDLVPYFNRADAYGEVYDGRVTISGNAAPAGGVMWVNGDLQISGPGVLEGCFIATGDIHVAGSGPQHKVASYPAFVSRDGDIKISGCGDYEGLIYARIGAIEVTGSCSITGSIICGGDFKKAGSSTVFGYVRSVPVAPDSTPTDGVLCVSAWQK